MKKKGRWILIGVLCAAIILEGVLMLGVFQAMGSARLPQQSIRLALQVVLLGIAIRSGARWPLYVLIAYHLFSLMAIALPANQQAVGYALGIYHVVIAGVVYFQENIERLLFASLPRQPKE